METNNDVLPVLCVIFLHDIAAISGTENKGVNLALNKSTRQSTSYSGAYGRSERAVDGDINPLFSKRSCTHTRQDDFAKVAWWEVDLRKRYKIREIKIQNRLMALDRLHDVRVDVYDNKCKPRGGRHCTTHPGPAGPGWLNLSCDSPVPGRYVRITKPKKERTDALTMCEVEIYGESEGNMYFKSHSKMNASGQVQKFLARSPLHCGLICGVTEGCQGFSVTQKEDGLIGCHVVLECLKQGENGEIEDGTTFYNICC